MCSQEKYRQGEGSGNNQYSIQKCNETMLLTTYMNEYSWKLTGNGEEDPTIVQDSNLKAHT